MPHVAAIAKRTATRAFSLSLRDFRPGTSSTREAVAAELAVGGKVTEGGSAASGSAAARGSIGSIGDAAAGDAAGGGAPKSISIHGLASDPLGDVLLVDRSGGGPHFWQIGSPSTGSSLPHRGQAGDGKLAEESCMRCRGEKERRFSSILAGRKRLPRR